MDIDCSQKKNKIYFVYTIVIWYNAKREGNTLEFSKKRKA